VFSQLKNDQRDDRQVKDRGYHNMLPDQGYRTYQAAVTDEEGAMV
jgi:hypothetical protein